MTIPTGRLLLAAAIAAAAVGGCTTRPAPPPDPRAPDRVVLGTDEFNVDIRIGGWALQDEFGPRFDNTAYVAGIKSDGREYLGQWGLSDEFGMLGVGVLGYDQAAAGASFLKIGVGKLKRIDPKPYDFTRRYPVTDFRTPHVDRGRDTLTLGLSDALRDKSYAYKYIKRYRIDTRFRVIVIEYELTNTGTKPWKFEHYNHNCIKIGDTAIGSAYYVQTEFPVIGKISRGFSYSGKRIVLTGRPRDEMYYVMTSDRPAPRENNRITVGLGHNETWVRITNDFPLARFAVYADQRGVCPQAFHQAELKPNRSATWKRVYMFNTN